MNKIIALCGISGVGKTHLRTTDPVLKDLPYVDIADIYQQEGGDISVRLAFQLMLDVIENQIEEGNKTIVAEAYFKRGSFQRDWLGFIAEKHCYEIEYIELTAPVEECVRRVVQQFETMKNEPGVKTEEIDRFKSYTNARLELLAHARA